MNSTMADLRRLLFLMVCFLMMSFQALAQVTREDLLRQGYLPWEFGQSHCQTCEVAFVTVQPELQDWQVQAFIQALSAHKPDLQILYRIDGQEYNLLAHMAVGILGRESHFFHSRRYQVKEDFPWAVRTLKIMSAYLHGKKAGPSASSRGPTQIKVVPERVENFYHIQEEDLCIPENAALATMGFLIEALQELKQRVVQSHLTEINPSNYVDYLPYIYFGASRALVEKRATPEKNIYVRDMKKYMSWVEVYERSDLASSMQRLSPIFR